MNDSLISFGKVYSLQQSQDLLDNLIKNTNWQGDFEAFGRIFNVPRLQAWHADEGIHYRYSDNKLQSYGWTEPLLAIKRLIETKTAHTFNSVLLTYYRNGNDYVSWHADDEPELGEAPVIASLSLGASREFHYRHKEPEHNGSIELHSGELLLMQPEFQAHWQHCAPEQPEIIEPRINLTFRKVIML